MTVGLGDLGPFRTALWPEIDEIQVNLESNRLKARGIRPSRQPQFSQNLVISLNVKSSL